MGPTLIRSCALLTFTALSLCAQPRWRLVEELKIGGAEEGPASFNEIRDIAVDARGRVFVLDYQTNEIRFFGADGAFIKLVGRLGAGPGEYRQPNGLRLAPDGTLWVNDHRNRRYVMFDPEGNFTTQALFPGWGYGYRWDGVFDAAGRLMETIPLRTPGADPAAQIIRRYDPARSAFDSLSIPECFSSTGQYQQWSVPWTAGTTSGVFSVPFAPLNVARVLSTGSYLCAMGDEYRVKVVELEGARATREFRSQSSPTPIPAQERDSVIAAITAPPSRIPPTALDRSRVPKNFPRVEEVTVDDAGRFWVRRRTASGLAIDIWSASGTQLATIDAPVVFTKYGPFVIRGDKLYVVLPSPDGDPLVVRYGIVGAAR
jgi:hypothetical protein